MEYKSNSLPHIASFGKHRSFLLHRSPPSISLPSCLSSSSTSPSSSPISLLPGAPEPNYDKDLLAPILDNPTLVLELKGTQPLDDEQVVTRGEEVIAMVKELLA
jgi:hypothetical protein